MHPVTDARFRLSERGSAIAGRCAIAVGILGLLALSNPSRDYYEIYVTDTLSDYLLDRVCARFPDFSEICREFTIEHEEDLREIVRDRTDRTNFGLFSLYHTEIELPVLPPIEIHAVGVLARFFPYEVRFPDGTDEI